ALFSLFPYTTLFRSILSEVRKLAAPFSNGQSEIGNLKLPLVELTGGEPLLQPNALPLMKALCDDNFTVLIETSGAHDVSKIDPRSEEHTSELQSLRH